MKFHLPEIVARYTSFPEGSWAKEQAENMLKKRRDEIKRKVEALTRSKDYIDRILND